MSAKNKTEISKQGSKYTDEERRNAVGLFIMLDSLTKVSEQTGIPEQTLSHWKNHAEWWGPMCEEVLDKKTPEMMAQYSAIINKAGEVAMDSLENGDEVIINKGGEIQKVRKKMPGKDAMLTGAIAFDKLRVLRNLPTSITTSADTQKKLDALFKNFERLIYEKEAKIVSTQ